MCKFFYIQNNSVYILYIVIYLVVYNTFAAIKYFIPLSNSIVTICIYIRMYI